MANIPITSNAIRYRDFTFRLIVCLIGAHIIMLHGEKITTLEAFTIRSYYPTLLINYLIALILAWIIRKITIKLDKTHSWEAHLWWRAMLQFFFGVVLVSLLSFLLVFIYFRSFGQSIMKSTYPVYQFPLSVALLALLNAFYVLYYFYHRVRILAANQLTTSPYQTYISVLDGKGVLSLNTEEIAYMFIAGKNVVVRTRDKNDYVCESYLDELESLLDPKYFFRINRQLIAHRWACKAYQPVEHGKIEVSLIPCISEGTTVSQRKATAFKDWVKQT